MVSTKGFLGVRNPLESKKMSFGTKFFFRIFGPPDPARPKPRHVMEKKTCAQKGRKIFSFRFGLTSSQNAQEALENMFGEEIGAKLPAWAALRAENGSKWPFWPILGPQSR
jgi:hypothetical protein